MTYFTNSMNFLLSMLISALMSLGPICSYNWLQFGGNPQHTGVNQSESQINPGNVSQLKRLFQVTLSSSIDGPIAYVSNVQAISGRRNLLFGTGWDGSIFSLDASDGAVVWSKKAFTGQCKILNTQYDCIVHSATAVDPNLKYVYSYSLDGYVHKYQVGDGTEVKDSNWPELATLKPDLEKQSASLVFATARNGYTYLYVPFASYPGDWGEYQGHLVTINLNNGSQNIFNMVCSNQSVHFTYYPANPSCPYRAASVWGRATLVYLPGLDRIYMATANGTYNPSLHDWGSSVVALHPDGSGTNGDPMDSYTPDNYGYLNNFDMDLGSTAPAVLPVPENSAVRYLGMQSGKDGKIRLLNLSNLSGQGGPGFLDGQIGPIYNVPIGNPTTKDYAVRTAQVIWINPADASTWVFITNDYGICAFKLVFDSGGLPGLSLQWTNTSYIGNSSPAMANGVLYMASMVDPTHGIVRALDPLNGNTLWSDNTIGTIHWSVPVVDNGILYISDENNHLTAYSLNNTIPQTVSCLFAWQPLIFNK